MDFLVYLLLLLLDELNNGLHLLALLRQGGFDGLQTTSHDRAQVSKILALMALVLFLLQETHGTERNIAGHAEVELFCVVFDAVFTFVPEVLAYKLFKRATAHEVGLSDLRATAWTARAALAAVVELFQTHTALDGRTLRAHPDLAADDLEAHDALAKRVHVAFLLLLLVSRFYLDHFRKKYKFIQ